VVVEEEDADGHDHSLPVRPAFAETTASEQPPVGRLTLGCVHETNIDVKELRHLLDAVVSVNSELSLPTVLHRILETATALARARYGALGVLDPSGTGMAQFLSTGLDPETKARIGAPPEGHGILGLLAEDPRPLRLTDLSDHPESFGFPPGHPPMASFLGVPIRVREQVFGNLYLTEKIGGTEFTEVDEELVVGLAAAAGVAIENTRLQARMAELRVIEERERIARDLHDQVIQRLFATGLTLEAASARTGEPEVAERLARAVTDLDDTIRHIRTTVFELQRDRLPGNSVRQQLLEVVDEVTKPAELDRDVRFDGPLDLTVSPTLANELSAVLREAVTNVVKHAGAGRVLVQVQVTDDELRLEVTDDGSGPPDLLRGGGHGLRNLAARADRLGGSMDFTRGDPRGATIRWWVPLNP
jgi:signal transduction histidine kinase